MNPYSEQSLAEEVLYLHSLWHRGPPRNPNFNKRPGHTWNLNSKKPRFHPIPPQDPGIEWPCPTPVQDQPSTSSGWPPIEPSATPTAAHPMSPEVRENLLAMQLQHKAVEACRGFFARNADSGSDEAEEEEEDEEEEDGAAGEMIESEEYKFFLNLFMENHKLRGYYEKNSEGGSFCCLVCGGMGKKKSGKRFKNCFGLVQHSVSISNTKKKHAHRAFGLAVCRVFGWDIDRLPAIVLKEEPLCRSLSDSGDLKIQPEITNVTKEQDCVVQTENVSILNNVNDEKNKGVSLDENENKLEEVKTAEDSVSNDANLITGENEDACNENDVNMQTENADNSLSGWGESIVNDEKNEVVSLDENEHKLEEVKAAEDLVSNDTNLITGENEDACNENDVNMQTENADYSLSGRGESNAELENLHVPESILKACKEFCAAFSTSMSDNDVSENNLTNGDGVEESEEFKFFAKLFTKNESLRRYYENKYDDGEFFCLACQGPGMKKSKSFKTCGRLLQHTTSIVKTKTGMAADQKPRIAKSLKIKMLTHWAYSLVVCKVLGWDFEKLPAGVLKGKPLDRSSTNPDVLKDGSAGNAVEDTTESDVPVEDDSAEIN